MTFDLEQYDAYLRRSLSAFTERSFLELHPGLEFLSNWHIDLIADKLQAVIEGRIRRLIITVPPRHLKSIIASICAPAFFLGHYPGARVLAVSYSPDLALSLALSSRRLMESDFYRRLFGDVLSRSKSAVGDFHTIGGGSRVSIACKVWAATGAGIASGAIGGVAAEGTAIEFPACRTLLPAELVKVAVPSPR